GVRAQVHVGGVDPAEEWGAGRVLALDPIFGGGDELVVAGLHALFRQRPGVLDSLLADLAEPGVRRRVVLVGGPAVQHAARTEALAELREVLSRRVIGELRLLFRVEVIEVAEELVEAVDRWQELVAVAEVVLAELAGRVAGVLEQFSAGRILGLEADRRPRHSDLRETGTEPALSRDERGAPGRARLLAIGVCELHPLLGESIDVRRPISHQPVAVAAQVRDADVVAPDHENVRLIASLRLPRRHLDLLASGVVEPTWRGNRSGRAIRSGVRGRWSFR